MGLFAIIALATPWSVFDYEVEGTNARLEGRVFLDRICYDCQSSGAGANECAAIPSTCVHSGVGGGTGSVVTLALALVCIVVSIAADLGRIFIDCLRPHRDVMIPALLGLSSLLFMLSFSIYSASSNSTVLSLSTSAAAQTITVPLSVTHQGAGFILTIFSWLISLFVVQPLFWLISRTHDFHNFLSHTSKATRSATLSHAGNHTLSVNPLRTNNSSREASRTENGVGISSAEPSFDKTPPKAVGSHNMNSSDMDLSRYLPRDMTFKTLAPGSPSHHHSLSLPPSQLSLAPPGGGPSRHTQSRSVDIPVVSSSAPDHRSPLGALQSQRAPSFDGLARTPTDTRRTKSSMSDDADHARARGDSNANAENNDIRIRVSVVDTSAYSETGAMNVECKGADSETSGGPQPVAPMVLTPIHAGSNGNAKQ